MMRSAQPGDRERIRWKAAWAVRQSGPVTSIARELGVHRSQPSRWRNGAEAGPAYAALRFIHALSRGAETTPFPFLVECRIEHMRGLLEARSDQWLIKRFHELRDELEPQAEAEAKVASRGEDRQKYRNAVKKVAAITTELAAVDEELERRNIDARHYRPDGSRLVRPIR